MMQTITSRDNAKIKECCAIRDSEKARRAARAFWAEGPKLCLELAKACVPCRAFFTQAALEKNPSLAALAARGEGYLIPPHVAEKLAGTPANQGVFALFETPVPDPALLQTARRLLALEGVQDPGNVGTLLRSAAAFGFDAVLLGPGCAAPFAPKTLRASMGAAGRLPVFAAPELPAALRALRGRGVVCLAAALYRAAPLEAAAREFPAGLCVVIGSEGQGLTDATIAACDGAVRIPMTDRVESLNAGVAGSILLWHFRGVCG